ncbi:MAG TPA: cytochrome C [Anaeromyxobacteraceae bacterium]|nr:cytochrome C [Anaeromyxobacteraceae bacterium]
MEHARHVFRVALLLIAGLAVVSIGRTLLVPRSYGLYGPYRYDNVAEQMTIREPVHGGPAACGECHEKEFKKRAAGKHKTVSCEVCHAPKAYHVRADGSMESMPIDRSFGLCARCHRKIPGRPAKFPQVVLEQHLNGPPEGDACIQCHDAHSPAL